jgi:hypothetical protein
LEELTVIDHESPDPTRHLLHQVRFEPQPDGSEVRRPISLAEAERNWRELASVDARRRAELGLEHSEEGEQTVAITRALAVGLAAMLEELSMRLAPGRAVGPIQAEADLVRVVAAYAGSVRAA